MQRSEVNAILQLTREFFMRQDVHLPGWADYGLSQWRALDKSVADELETRLNLVYLEDR